MRRVGVGFRVMDVALGVAMVRPDRVIAAVAREQDTHQLAVFMASYERCVRCALELAYTYGIGHFDFPVFREYGDIRDLSGRHN
jgi:hypothetical protein